MGESIGQVAIFAVLLMNFGGLVWGAARIKMTTDLLTAELGRLRKTVGLIENNHAHLDKRLAIVEDRQEREV